MAMRWPQLWSSQPELTLPIPPVGADTPDHSTGPDAPVLPTAGMRHKGSPSSSGGRSGIPARGSEGRGSLRPRGRRGSVPQPRPSPGQARGPPPPAGGELQLPACPARPGAGGLGGGGAFVRGWARAPPSPPGGRHVPAGSANRGGAGRVTCLCLALLCAAGRARAECGRSGGAGRWVRGGAAAGGAGTGGPRPRGLHRRALRISRRRRKNGGTIGASRWSGAPLMRAAEGSRGWVSR